MSQKTETLEEATSTHDGNCACGNAEHATSDQSKENMPDGIESMSCDKEGIPSSIESMPCDKESMPDEELLYDLADLFKTFGDTTRIKILYSLMGQDLCVADIAELIGATQSAVSHQLRTLKQARLVKFQREGKNVIYSLSDDHVYTMLAQGMTHICE